MFIVIVIFSVTDIQSTVFIIDAIIFHRTSFSDQFYLITVQFCNILWIWGFSFLYCFENLNGYTGFVTCKRFFIIHIVILTFLP